MSETLAGGTQPAETAAIEADTTTPIETAEATETQATETEANTTEKPSEPKRRPWYELRIAEEAHKAREATRKANELEAALRQQQSRQTPAPNAQPVAKPPDGMVPLSEVQAIMARERAEQDFTKACNDIAEAGETAFGKDTFQESVNTLSAIGIPPSFLEMLTEFPKDEAAKLYYALGRDPDEAARIVKLSPARQAAALAKMAATPAKAAPVSKAPPPITPLSSTSTRSGAEPDSKDIKAWAAWFQKQRSR